jgi:hypothetical protein
MFTFLLGLEYLAIDNKCISCWTLRSLLLCLTYSGLCADVEEGGETAFPDSNKWVFAEQATRQGSFSPCAAGSVAFKPKKVSTQTQRSVCST